MKTTGWVLATVLVTWIVAMAVGDVGTVPECKGKPIEWILPFGIFLYCVGLVVAGFYIGRGDNND